MASERFWRDFSGRLTYDVSRISSEDYPATCRAIMDAFFLTPNGSLIIGLDQMFWDFRQADQLIGLDWDIWMGFMVVAQTDSAEPLVRDIAAWLGYKEDLQ